jgi:hypothetical protein
MRMFSTRIFCLFMLISALFISCQKDENVKNLKTATSLQADSSIQLNSVSTPGNYLASKGTLKIKIQDSTYTFDAEQDSIAFVNINISGEEYYGVTAINKAHTVSFGISSSAVPIAEMTSFVSGCQFLLRAPGKKNLEYTLTRNAPRPLDFGTIAIEQYNQDTILAKGTFHTYLAKDTKLNSPFYIAEGSFDLKVK